MPSSEHYRSTLLEAEINIDFSQLFAKNPHESVNGYGFYSLTQHD